jgi:hypothetical protein
MWRNLKASENKRTQAIFAVTRSEESPNHAQSADWEMKCKTRA